MAEQLAFQQIVRKRPTVDWYEGEIAPGAEIVKGARRQFLAGAGFTLDQHTDIDGGHSLDDAQRILKGEGLTEQVEPSEGFGPFTVAHRRPDAVLHNGPLSRRLRIPPRHAGSNRRARMRELVNYAGSR